MFILYDYDSNAILSVALPDGRGSPSVTRG